MSEKLNWKSALNNSGLVSPTVAGLLKNWKGAVPVQEILVAGIDTKFAGGDDFCSYYGIPISQGANCVIVEARRGNISTLAACLAPVHTRMDFNGIVRRTLNARKVSLANLDKILAETKMEYGSITVFGLPSGWPILIDSKIVTEPRIVIGSGLLRSKLSLPGKALAELPDARVIDGLAIPVV